MEDRIYHIILDVAVFVSVLSVVAGLLQGQPTYAILSTVLILLYLIVLQYITMRYPKYSNTCRVLLVLGMNLVMFPVHFFTSGGINSGMILFHLTGLVLCAMLIFGIRNKQNSICHRKPRRKSELSPGFFHAFQRRPASRPAAFGSPDRTAAASVPFPILLQKTNRLSASFCLALLCFDQRSAAGPLNRRNCSSWGDCSLSVDLSTNDIPAAGGHSCFVHRRLSAVHPLRGECFWNIL